MKTNILLACAFSLLVSLSYGQANVLNAQSPDEIGKKSKHQTKLDATEKPLPYGHTDDRDILWSQNVWEFIDLNQRVNFPLLYPLDNKNVGNERKSLYQVLLDNIENGNIETVYSDSYFKREQSMEDLDATLHRADTLEQGKAQINAGEELDPQFVRHTDVDGSDVMGYRIRGLWYFDNKQGDLRYRIIGLAPMVIDAFAKEQGDEDAQPVELFWVFYPEARQALHEAYAFNPDNSARPLTFDELLNARRFSGVIYKSDNEYGDREIRDYVGESALKQLLEAERIKEKIRDFESNMWDY